MQENKGEYPPVSTCPSCGCEMDYDETGEQRHDTSYAADDGEMFEIEAICPCCDRVDRFWVYGV